MDIVLEYCQWELQLTSEQFLVDDKPLGLFLQWVDGVAVYYEARGVPSAFVALIMKICRLHKSDARERAAAACNWTSAALNAASPLWQDLKPALKAALEAGGAPSCVSTDTLKPVRRSGR